jgi:hypothetical protein
MPVSTLKKNEVIMMRRTGFYLDQDIIDIIVYVYTQRLRQNQKTSRSEIVTEALLLLKEKYNGIPKNPQSVYARRKDS